MTTTITPTTGSLTGGDSYIISGSSLSMSGYEDSFPGTVLNPALWVSTTSGSGSVSVDTGLRLSTGTTVGVAMVTTVAIYQNLDISVLFTYNNAVEQLYPLYPIEFMSIVLNVDSNNYIKISHVWDSTMGSVIKVSNTVNSVSTVLCIATTYALAKSLRVVRFGGSVYVYAGASLIYIMNGWRTDAVTISLASRVYNTAPIASTTVVSIFQPKILVSFGVMPSPIANEVSGRIVGSVPSYDLPVDVPVVIHTLDTSETVSNVFTYVSPPKLTILSGHGINVAINDDSILRDTSSQLLGLRL